MEAPDLGFKEERCPRPGVQVRRSHVATFEQYTSLCKAELIHRPGQGPWKSLDDADLATLGWVTWFNTTRIHGTLNVIPPAE